VLVKVAEPWESAVPILVTVEPWTKSMMMQLGLSVAHARKFLRVMAKQYADWLPSGHGLGTPFGAGGPLVGSTVALALSCASTPGAKSESATTPARVNSSDAISRRLGDRVRITAGGYVEGGGAC
jgi:hypothetical protein